MTTQPGSSYDVLIVGYGPAGQTLAILLAQRGHRIAVVERWQEVYPRPRAVTFDDEVARIFASAGMARRFADFSEPNLDYEWRNAAGDTLLQFDFARTGPSGWPESSMFTQPKLETALRDRVATFGNVDIHHGEAVRLKPYDDCVEIGTRRDDGGREILRAPYVVGCDGARSFVREHMNTEVTDLGFFYDWLICDVITHRPRTWSPVNLQVCDPQRPTTVVSGGPGRRRWEFMRMPGESTEDLDREETAWRLLAAWDITPQNATLERKALYTFQAKWADTWRDGRVLIAGDAAHLMPPFAGQGMCSGVRDTANLAWKLDLVLRGISPAGLLTTYSTERAAHVQHAIFFSMELGKVICETDPKAAAARDEALIAAGATPHTALPPPPPQELGPGALQTSRDGTPLRPAGQTAVQGRVRDAGGRTGLLDDVAGFGFHILADGEHVTSSQLTPSLGHSDLLAAISAKIVRIVPAGAAPAPASGPEITVEDCDGVLLPHLRACGQVIQIVRPDFNIFGGTPDAAGLTPLLSELEKALVR